jgi:hypothetical protein
LFILFLKDEEKINLIFKKEQIMKTIKLYSVPGTNLAESDDCQSLRKFADSMGYSDIDIIEIDIPWLETGDRIVISKCIGSSDNEDGISSGGQWVDVEGIWEAWEQGEFGNKNNMHGRLLNENGMVVAENVDADMRYDGFPYRNVRMSATEGIETIEIGEYTGYHHNAYDGYECSWGVVIALGGSGNAFTEDEKICGDAHVDDYGEYTCDCATVFSTACENWEDGFDCQLMLQNLDETVEEIQAELDDTDDCVIYQYFGDRIPIHFYKKNGDVLVEIEIPSKKWIYIVDNLDATKSS